MRGGEKRVKRKKQWEGQERESNKKRKKTRRCTFYVLVNFEPGSSSVTAINANHNIMSHYDLQFLQYNYHFLNLTFPILSLQKVIYVCLFVDFYHDNNTFLLLTVEIWGWGPIYCSLPPQWGILFSFVYITNLGK